MSRSNSEIKSIVIKMGMRRYRISKNLFWLIETWRRVCEKRGEKFIKHVSFEVVCDSFVKYYWNVSAFTSIGRLMRKISKERELEAASLVFAY